MLHGSKDRADFFKPRIDELPLHYVQDWYHGAYDPGGIAKETWAYLLPRILEILASGEDANVVALELTLGRFATGNPEKWSKDEWQVLDRFQRLYLRHHIEQPKEGIDDVVCMFRLGGWPLQDLLDQVKAASDTELANLFWNNWCAWTAPGLESVWITPFWENPDNSSAFDFYTSKELYGRMEALVLADDTDAEVAAKASAVVSVIETAWFPRRPGDTTDE